MFFLPTYPIFKNHVIGTTHIFCFGLMNIFHLDELLLIFFEELVSL